jgi:HAE1 family hydrophobic/amphiphilic exporter-1
MKLSRLAIHRPVTVSMVFIGFALIGLFASTRLPVEEFPEVELPFVRMSIPYADATTQEIERNVTRPVEEVLSTMSGVEKVLTFTRPGNLTVAIRLDLGGDVTGKGIEAKELIESIRDRLPDDIRYIRLHEDDPNSSPVMNVMIQAPDLDEAVRHQLMETRVKTELERLPGVNTVNVYGVVRDYVRISLDPNRIAAYGLDYIDVQQRLQRSNFFVSSGRVDTGNGDLQVRPLGRYDSLEDIRRVPVNDSGLVLGDIAIVDRAPVDENDRRRVNGEKSLGVSVYKRPEANLVEVSGYIDRKMAAFDQDPAFSNISFLPLDSQAETVLKSLNDLRDSGFLGGVLSVIVLFLFLRRLSLSILIAGTVPLALCATLGLMYFLGMSLNILSLVGLMLAIGLLVDNSVVAAEAIALKRQQSLVDPKTAAEQGISEVSLAIIAGTLTTIIVFIPSIMSDVQIVAVIQQNIAIPLCLSLLASLLISQTLVPSVMARIPILDQRQQGPFLNWLTDRYERALTFALHRKWMGLTLATAMAASGVAIYQQLDVNMNPDEESPRLELDYFIRGSVDIEYMEGFVEQVDAYLLSNKERFEIENVFTRYDTDSGKTIVNLKPDGTLSPRAVEALIKKNIPELPNIVLRFGFKGRGFGGGGGRSSLGLRLIGESTETLIEVADDFVALLEQHPNLINVSHDGESNREEIRISMLAERTSQLGINAIAVSQAVSVALGGRPMRRGFVDDDREVEIYLELDGQDNADLETLRSLPIFTSTGETVALESIAEITRASTLRVVRRENRQTSLNVNFSVREGPPSLARAIVENLLQSYQLPPGYSWEYGEEFDRDVEEFREMAINGLFALILIYMLMAALFESVLFPTVVVMSIGYAMVGAFAALWLTGTTMTSMAVTGMLLLGGIVVNNAIVLLNRVQQLRRHGMARTEAIIASGRHRFRPILMTVCTTVFAMLPLAVGEVRIGGLGPSYFPMARALIGGLIFSTVITLLVLPLYYILFDDIKESCGRFARSVWLIARR